jgi:hypothetical protein
LFEFKKTALLKNQSYQFEGITCSGCMIPKFTEIKEVLNVSMNSNFTEIMISVLKKSSRRSTKIVSYDENYKIIKITQ